MVNLVIASVNKEQLSVWIDVLSLQYPVTFFNNIEFVFSKNKQVGKSDLLVLDADFIDDAYSLSAICQKSNKVIVVGNKFTLTQQFDFIYQGAWGYSDRIIEQHLILRAVESVMNDEIWLKRQYIPQMLKGIMDKQKFVVNKGNTSDEIVKKITNLTQREIEVIKHIYNGENNIYIAEKLYISKRTVKAHLSAIFRKLNVVDRFQLVVFLKNMQVSRVVKGGYSEDDNQSQ